MRETNVARRYAHALFNVALKKGTMDIIASEIYQLKSFNEKDDQFVSFLCAPQVLTEHKVELIKNLFTTRLSPSLLSFLLLLIEKSRINLLDDIAREFEEMLEEYKGLIKAVVTTSVHVSDDYKERLRVRLEEVTGKQIEVVHKIDNDILGGIIVQLNYNVIDRSIRSKLNSLKHELKSIKVY